MTNRLIPIGALGVATMLAGACALSTSIRDNSDAIAASTATIKANTDAITASTSGTSALVPALQGVQQHVVGVFQLDGYVLHVRLGVLVRIVTVNFQFESACHVV